MTDRRAPADNDAAAVRGRIRVNGTVQGVGFRPFVYREARALGLAGFVLNDSDGVLIEAEGSEAALAGLCEALAERAPPLARVTGIDTVWLKPSGLAGGFEIVKSTPTGTPAAPVSVDTATCADCLREVDDPADRRYRYPFTNCTNCGPRYTIVMAVPYDRPATTMAGFKMCPECQAEYDDPGDRRFHAQPNSCPVCGPQIAFSDATGRRLATAEEALEMAVATLLEGRIVAVKGLGGYHLAADATNARAVQLLRARKERDEKPFAMIVGDLAMARAVANVDDAAAALISTRRPIVLVPRRAAPEIAVAEAVAPGLPELGLMLPYTPLHHLIVGEVARPLVLTSGNISDEPIAHLDKDAVERLGPMSDGLLTHDRPIHIRCDDSVLRSAGGRLQLIRRSRGYAPEPLRLSSDARRQVLAVGAELKNTVSVAKGRQIVTSHHIGDLEHLATYRSFLQATGHMCGLFGVNPEIVVHDLHPEYLSTKYAADLDVETWAVQHHHAHVASCLAEHQRTDRVLGIAFDGLGYGLDGDLWGGEFLVADLERFERTGHLLPVSMPGASAAIREPWRMAVAWAYQAATPAVAARVGSRLDHRWRPILSLVERAGNRGRLTTEAATIRTTSVGRLFDAVAALIGLRNRVTYEGQAAIELEAAAAEVPDGAAPSYPVRVARRSDGIVLDPSPLVATIIDETEKGRPTSSVAAGFHRALAKGAVEIAASIASERGLRTVALTGGVFQNVRLTRLIQHGLTEQGLEVLLHGEVPPNDGGISVGQAAIGALAGGPPPQ